MFEYVVRVNVNLEERDAGAMIPESRFVEEPLYLRFQLLSRVYTRSSVVVFCNVI